MAGPRVTTQEALNNMKTALDNLDREKTFTGYDIIYDTDKMTIIVKIEENMWDFLEKV